jgi:polysaccharide export outer membrane protein
VSRRFLGCVAFVAASGVAAAAGAQTAAAASVPAPAASVPAAAAAAPGVAAPGSGASAATVVPPGITPPPGYTIGPDDVLTIVFWREKDMGADVTVRPDGKISLPLINDITAAGLTPEQLRVAITGAADKFITDPTVSVVVKSINSRRVFITGQVNKPSQYGLSGPMTVLQLIAMAGGVLEYADSEHITIVSTVDGKPVSFGFNYKEVVKRKNLQQNVQLKPGDTVIVP